MDGLKDELHGWRKAADGGRGRVAAALPPWMARYVLLALVQSGMLPVILPVGAARPRQASPSAC